MTKEEVCQLFMAGIDCSQVVTGACAEKMGMTKEQARKMSACFGGGMMCGETCGAVTGMFLVAGMLKGYDDPADYDGKKAHYARIRELAEQFRQPEAQERFGELSRQTLDLPAEVEDICCRASFRN